ncbi:MAG: hypothetical protein QM817_11875 [Archangium sp.]
MDDRQATREALLAPTIEFAAREVPFYRRTFGKRRELTSLPFLHKDVAIARQRELLSGAPEAFTGVISSGTHHAEGALLQVPRTEDEAQATRAFFDAVNRGKRITTKRGWTLEVRAAHHGTRDVAPGRLLVPWTYTAQSLRLVEQMLAKKQADGPRVDTLVINSGALMPLTSWFLSRGVAPARFRIAEIGTTSFKLSPFWRALIEEVWGCAVRDNFSLSELPAPAHECSDCGFHHWEPPPMFAEVVDPITHAPARTGVLVVTTLAPFVTRMPLIRYWTGDLVTLGPRCAAVGEAGFRPRGRLSQSIWHRTHGLVVSSQDVTDFLEGRAEVARHPHPMETLRLIPPGECGAVKFELTQHKREVRLRVELRFDPMIFSTEANAVGDALVKHLSAGVRAYERAGDGELIVELVRPGTLTSKWVKF